MAADATTVERARVRRRLTLALEPMPLGAGGLCPGPWQALELPFGRPGDEEPGRA